MATCTDSAMSPGFTMGGISALRNAIRNSFPAFHLNSHFNLANEAIQHRPPLKFKAENVNASIWLKTKLSGLEKAQNIYSKIRFLPGGRILYSRDKASKPGITKSASYVTEWSIEKGQVRSWMECYDHFDQTIRVHPKTINGQTLDSIHYPPIGSELGKIK